MRYDDLTIDIWPADECHDKMGDRHKAIWNLLYGDDQTGGILDRSVINPVHLKQDLSNIWMAKVAWGDDDIISNVQITLLGTEVVRIFGERTGQDIMADRGQGSFKEETGLTYLRMIKYLEYIRQYQRPIWARTDRLESDIYHISAQLLLIPMRHSSDEINMVIGHVNFDYQVI